MLMRFVDVLCRCSCVMLMCRCHADVPGRAWQSPFIGAKTVRERGLEATGTCASLAKDPFQMSARQADFSCRMASKRCATNLRTEKGDEFGCLRGMNSQNFLGHWAWPYRHFFSFTCHISGYQQSTDAWGRGGGGGACCR